MRTLAPTAMPARRTKAGRTDSRTPAPRPSTTRATDSRSSNSTSETEARIVVVWSDSTLTCSAAGKVCSSRGKIPFTAFTTASTLDPGCRWMFRIIAGILLAQAANSAFCVPSTTVATSESRIALPFL